MADAPPVPAAVEDFEDDEAEIAKELQNFIVDDAEDDDGGEEEEEDDDDEDESDDDKLDEEDLELINENLRQQEELERGSSSREKFRRLKRAALSSDDEEENDRSRNLFEDDEVAAAPGEEEEEEEFGASPWAEELADEGASVGLSGMQRAQLQELFGNDLQTLMDILSGRRPKQVSKTQNEDDYDDPDYGVAAVPMPMGAPQKVTLSDEEVAREAIRTANEPERLIERYKHRPRPVAAETLRAEALWILEKFRSFASTSTLPFNRISTSAPEAPFPHKPLYPSFPLCDIFNEAKQRKRYDEVFRHSGEGCEKFQNPGEYFFPKTTSIDAELTDKIIAVLHLLLNERFDVPYIVTHQGHLLFPPLTPEAVWKIFDWDVQWWRLNETKKGLLVELRKIPNVAESLVTSLENTLDEAILADFRHYIASQAAREEPPPPAPPEEDGKKRPPIKRRRTTASADGLYQKYFLSSGLRSRWAPYVASPEAFVTILKERETDLTSDMEMDMDEDDDTSTFAAPDIPPIFKGAGEDGTAAMNAWLSEIAATDSAFQSPEKLYDGIVKFEARALAVHPHFRQFVRSWLSDKIFISTVTTAKAERQMDPIKPSWLPCRLYRKPLRELCTDRAARVSASDRLYRDAASITDPSDAHEKWRREIKCEMELNRVREFGIEIAKAEKAELIQVVVHPLAPNDPAPWRGQAADDIRWRKGATAVKSRQNSRPAAETDGYVREWQAFEKSDREDQTVINTFVERMAKSFYPKDSPAAWRRLLTDIISTAVIRETLPALRKEARAKLLQASEEYVIERCQQALLWRLSQAPPSHPFVQSGPSWPDFSVDDEDGAEDDTLADDELSGYEPTENDQRRSFDRDTLLQYFPLVTSVVVEKDSESLAAKARIHVVSLNRQGVASDFQRLDSLFEYTLENGDLSREARKDAAKLEKILLNRRTRPNIVVVGVNCLSAINLMEYLAHLRSRIKVERNRFELFWVPLEVPQLFAQSELCPADLRENHGLWAAQALSAARLVQDPLAETAGLWSSSSEAKPNYLLSLRLHHLQGEVRRDLLEPALHNVLIRAVNDIGVHINRLRTAKHLRPLLQFVSGLGPIKAKAFLTHFYMGVLERSSLTDSEKLNTGDNSHQTSIPPHVYHNCASFLRIREGEEFGLERDDEPDPLEDSRIHPEDSAAQARKMCRDAQEELLADPDDDRPFVDATFKHPEALEELDLEAYSVILEKQQRPRMLPLLEFIKREIEAPFSDPRCPYRRASDEVVFYRLTAEDPILFREGTEVNIRRIVSRENGVLERKWVVEPTGVSAILHDSEMDRREAGHDHLMKARVSRIDFCALEVHVSGAANPINDLLRDVLHFDTMDHSTLSPLIFDDVQSASLLKRRTLDVMVPEQAKQRRIHHPLFRLWSHNKLLDFMRASSSVGQTLFRASESRQNSLVMYFQTAIHPFKFKIFQIRENDQLDSTGVGTELQVNGERFHALDEIVGSYCQPYRGFLSDIFSHEKFHTGVTPDDLATTLSAQAQRDFRSIQWGIALDPNNLPREPAERCVLVAVCNSSRSGQLKVIKDSLYVSPRGFRLWLRSERNIWSLLSWWKSEGFQNRQSYWTAYQRAKAT